ncbi:hypothetical protein OIE66_09175 [Nonomuraea sp. NBC_01738]|uniref:hypothetical protein n=1 Tax=Nonomuraea sp. NBC_01738 TaxID=2976003 RepID=UPI002E142603|nr:hypothetical protein OIE66_09175 [Nonomuraea sp. NBC_01738]
MAFWVLSVLAVAAGIAVFVVDSMARATFALLASLVAVGLTFLLIDLEYLGVLVILMMVMEMMVMAVFMIMFMMNPAGLMPMTMVHNRRGPRSSPSPCSRRSWRGSSSPTGPPGVDGFPRIPRTRSGCRSWGRKCWS